MAKKKDKKKLQFAKPAQVRQSPPTTFDYPPPLDKLLTQGDCRATIRKWPDYRQLGLTEEHIPELIRMATDKALLFADDDSDEVWAPIHAWRALGQLQAEAAIEPLLNLFHELEDWDWISEDMPRIFKMIGPAAIPALSEYIADESHGLYPRVTAMNCLEEIGKANREVRASCVAPLVRELEKYEQNEPEFNAFVIGSFMDMQESSALPLMERAFKAGRVDEEIVGDWQDVRAEFGLTPASDDDPFKSALYEERPPSPGMGTFSRFIRDDKDVDIL